MSSQIKLFLSIVFTLAFLVGCGGGDGDTDVNIGSGDGNFSTDGDSGTGTGTGGTGDGATDGDSDDDESTVVTSQSFVYLQPLENSGDFVDTDFVGAFRGDGMAPLIDEFNVSPIQVNGQPIASPDLDDFFVTIDEVETSPDENFNLLQRVIGTPVTLLTAIIFDLSNSTDDADFDELIAEVQEFVNQAKASDNDTIANQLFTVWAFGNTVQELTSDFTDDDATITAALNSVITNKDAETLGTGSNLHRAVVQAIGRYSSDDPVLDFGADGNNDLFDVSDNDFAQLSNIILFSSGSNSVFDLSAENMADGIGSQTFQAFESSTNSIVDLPKPLLYNVIGGTTTGDSYQNVADNAESTAFVTLSGGEYSFAESLLTRQIAAVDRRIDLDNRYVYRVALLDRMGDHTLDFSNPAQNNTITADFEEDDGVYIDPDDGLIFGTPEEELSTLVEITGPNGEYLARGVGGADVVQTAGAGSVNFSDVSTFGFATRWVDEVYVAGDYSWAISAGGTGAVNADGTYTVATVTGSAVLTLTNDTLGGANNVAEITINE